VLRGGAPALFAQEVAEPAHVPAGPAIPVYDDGLVGFTGKAG
jgi:hypothetical protein